MSRSRKLPIYKDGSGRDHRRFRKRIRRISRLKVKDILSLLDPETYEIPNPKSIINDWDWCDYIVDYHNEPNRIKLSRSDGLLEKLARK